MTHAVAKLLDSKPKELFFMLYRNEAHDACGYDQSSIFARKEYVAGDP